MKNISPLFTNETIAETCYEICEESFDTGSPWTKEQLLSSLTADNQLFFMTVKNKTIICFGIFSVVLDEAEIELIAVDSRVKRQGYGEKLLDDAIKQLKEEGIREIFLEVRKSNLIAQNFYKAFQFKEIGKRKNYYQQPKEDGLMFKLTL